MIKVINVNSLSFTGTTWINALLGTHSKCLAIGPPDRVLNVLLSDNNDELCRIHKKECVFWSGFKEQFDKSKNFYLQLAEYSQAENIIINNPIAEGVAEKQLLCSQIIVKNINVVRDGRAISASYLRQYPESDAIDVINNWFLPSAKTLYFDTNDLDILCMRYEDILDDALGSLIRIGKFIDLEYTSDNLEFWNYEQHLTAGNAGVFNTIRFFDKPGEISFKDAEYIKEQVLLMKTNPSKAFKKARWKNEFSQRELFVFDYFAGDINEIWGYKRDNFNASEFRNYKSELRSIKSAIGLDDIYSEENGIITVLLRLKKIKEYTYTLFKKIYRKIRHEYNKRIQSN